jgi:hypothetical protein
MEPVVSCGSFEQIANQIIHITNRAKTTGRDFIATVRDCDRVGAHWPSGAVRRHRLRGTEDLIWCHARIGPYKVITVHSEGRRFHLCMFLTLALLIICVRSCAVPVHA